MSQPAFLYEAELDFFRVLQKEVDLVEVWYTSNFTKFVHRIQNVNTALEKYSNPGAVARMEHSEGVLSRIYWY